MSIKNKIATKLSTFVSQKITKEQYPMLTSFSRRKLQKDGALGLVYMLHHVQERDKTRIPTNEDLKVSPSFLSDLIIGYEKQGFEFLSLDQLYDLILSGTKPEKPFAVFTIDDGYLDNYVNALPVFEEHSVPFAVFVATDFIDQKAILWWDSLEDLIHTHQSIKLSNGVVYSCTTFQQRWDTFRRIREIILKLDQDNLLIELSNLFSGYQVDWLSPIKTQAMSWEQIAKLSAHPLCTIGGHTVSHPALNRVSDERFDYEISTCISKLQAVTGKKIKHFAYPYGTANEIGEREQRLISKYNFDTIFFANGGCVTVQNFKIASNLPRVYLHEKV